MPVSEDAKVSFLLTGGIDERSVDELAGPLLEQGGAPRLIHSINTRLGVVPGSCARSPAVTTIPQAAGTVCYGLAPAANGKKTAAFFRATEGGNVTIADSGRATYGSGSQYSIVSTTLPANGYLPFETLDAGGIAAPLAYDPPAVTWDSELSLNWFAYLAPTASSTSFSVYVHATNADGVISAQPRKIATVSAAASDRRWVGLTAHSSNGVQLWYLNGTDIVRRSLTISGNVLTVGAASTVVTLTTAQNTKPDVCSFPFGATSQYAYLACSSPAAVADGYVMRVDVTSGATTTLTVANALLGTTRNCAIVVDSTGAATRVAYAFSSETNANTTIGFVSTTLGAIWSTTAAKYGVVSLAFHVQTAQSVGYVVAFISGGTGVAFSAGGTYDTTAYSIDFAVGVAGIYHTWVWASQYARAAQWRISTSENYPLVPLAPYLGGDAVLDPSVDLYLIRSTVRTAVAKWGVLRGVQAPASGIPVQMNSRSLVFMYGQDKLLGTYVQQSFALPYAPARFVAINTAPSQPGLAHDRDGGVLVAAALPVQWDGVELVEMGGPMHAPHLRVDMTAGSGSILTAGTYKFQAIYRWSDATGLVHRSIPSPLVTIVADGVTTKPAAVATSPESFRDGLNQPRVETVLYVSKQNGLNVHEYPTPLTGGGGYTTTWSTFTNAELSTIEQYPEIYSGGTAGEELTPQPPPPLYDVTVIGSRAWGVDAENRSRLVYSKLRIAGVGYEWHPALEVVFPSGAGKITAIRDFEGFPLVLTERGVYRVSGYGPTNNGQGDSFAPPNKLSDLGCTNRRSVVVFPAGIIWQSDVRLVFLGSNGISIMPNVTAATDVRDPIVLKNEDEVVFHFVGTNVVKVYNYALDAWTTWDSNDTEVTQAVNQPDEQEIALIFSGGLRRMDGKSLSGCPSMTWETDWLLLGGDFQDRVIIRSVVFNGRILGAHSLTIEMYTDYDTAAPNTTRTWDSATLASIAIGDRYTLRMEPEVQAARAVKLRIYDTLDSGPAEGVRPRSVTVVFAKEECMLNEEAFLQGSYQ